MGCDALSQERVAKVAENKQPIGTSVAQTVTMIITISWPIVIINARNVVINIHTGSKREHRAA
jgi:hypothetical protein